MSHSKPQRSVASRSASSAATIAARRAIELGLATICRSRSSLGSESAGTRAPGNALRFEAWSRLPLRHEPWPEIPIHSSSRAGAASMPISGRRSLISATDTAHPVRPRMKSRVPSIGSTSQIRPRPSRAGSSAVSSDSQPAAGKRRPSSRLRKVSTARSAAQTGLPGAFSQVSTVCPAPGQAASAIRPASRTIFSRRERSIIVQHRWERTRHFSSAGIHA